MAVGEENVAAEAIEGIDTVTGTLEDLDSIVEALAASTVKVPVLLSWIYFSMQKKRR